MKKCIAFVAAGRSENSWRPCRQRARARSVFCSRHEEVFAGVMLGVCVHSYPGPADWWRPETLADMPVANCKPS